MNKEEIDSKIIRDNCNHYRLINELLAIRDRRYEKEDYTICVNGYISLDSIKETIELEDKVEQLESKSKISKQAALNEIAKYYPMSSEEIEKLINNGNFYKTMYQCQEKENFAILKLQDSVEEMRKYKLALLMKEIMEGINFKAVEEIVSDIEKIMKGK